VPAALRPLRDRILKATRPALVSGSGRVFIEVTLGADDVSRRQRTHDEWLWPLYVAPPIREQAWLQQLQRLRLPSRGAVAAFVRHFDSLRESEPGLAGGFKPVTDWRTIEEDRSANEHSWYLRVPARMLREWAGSLIVFVARNGDHILLHPSRKVGWMNHEKAEVRKHWDSFGRFIGYYADFLEYRWPFDSWGPSKEAASARRERARRVKSE
jgi:hypothetical protein